MTLRLLHIMRAHSMAGAEKHLFMMLPELARRGCQVTLLTITDGALGNRTEEYGQALERLGSAGVKVVETWVAGKADWRAIGRIRAVVNDVSPDMVHTHMPFSDLFGGIAGRLAGARTVLSTRHYDYSHSTRALLKAGIYYRAARPFHDAVIAISNRVAELCRRAEGWRPSAVHTILYGCADEQVDKTGARKSVRRELELANDELIIGTVARLVDWKGHNFALDALEKLRKRQRQVTWLFIGDGPERRNLETKAADLGVQDQVHFLGHRTDVANLMAGLDMMVHPAIAEGFGIIFLEAMMQSTPVVASRAGAMPDIIDDGVTGVLVRPGRSDDIANAVERLASDEPLRKRFGAAGRARFEERFSLERMVDETEAVYASLLSARGASAE